MEYKLISVIIPIYNVENYLEKCVNSVLAQNYPNIEILLIDDGSTDNSRTICREFEKNYPDKVRAIFCNHGGISVARNVGLSEAKGDYISFVDSDDFIDPNMFIDMMDSLVKTNSDISVCGRYDDFIDKTELSFILKKEQVFDSQTVVKKILTWDDFDVALWDKIYKRELFENISFPVGRINEDICIILDVISKANKIVHVGKPYYHYYHRPGSITRTYDYIRVSDYFYSMEQVIKFMNENYPTVKNEMLYYVNNGFYVLLRLLMKIDFQSKDKRKIYDYFVQYWKKCTVFDFFKLIYLFPKYKIFLRIIKKFKYRNYKK